MHNRVVPILILASVTLAGCSLGRGNPEFLIPAKRVAVVRDTAERYGDNLRWGRLDAALGMVEPDRRAMFLATSRDANPPLRFTNFEIVAVELGTSREEVEVLASFRLYRLPNLSERSVHELQVWRFDPARGRWYIRPDLSLFLDSGVSAGGR